ncbi:hypothetical protein [Enterovibrio norvegicus]|uniref:hypothetical protein n=1 Tax=Enterovibrio norvegicus TaxID=188144 RepID=UPI00352F2D66
MKLISAFYRLLELKEMELKQLEEINKKLDLLTECIDKNQRYGGAIKTTVATRY